MSHQGQYHQIPPDEENNTKEVANERASSLDFQIIKIDIARCHGGKIFESKDQDTAILYQTRSYPRLELAF